MRRLFLPFFLFLCVSYSETMPNLKALQRAVTYTNPLVPLEFWEKAKRKPRKKNLKPANLLKKMGRDFDPDRMSIEQPHKDAEVQMSETQIASLVEQVTNLNLDREMTEMTDQELMDNEKSKMLSVFQQWLLKKSSCPVSYSWNDLGEYFWPRWIRKGNCEKKGCSWPRGMNCIPDEAHTLQILRWHCRRRRPRFGTSSRRQQRRKENKDIRCKWYKVPYPVTSSCKCDCET